MKVEFSMMKFMPFVSVIIPVFNDVEKLKICLSALEEQSYPKELYEVIVVDNASQVDIKSTVSAFNHARYEFEECVGSYAARNKGILAAKGEIIAFTDADCIPTKTWLEAGVDKLLETENCGLVAGRVELFFKDPKKPTPIELYESVELNFNQDENLKNDHFGVTANLFTYKSILDRVGGFDSSLKSGGDRLWGCRVFEQGYQQVYAADALVMHPARSSLKQHQRRVSRFVGGQHDLFMSSNPSIIDIIKDWIGTLRPPFRSLFRAWKNPNLKSNLQKTEFILVIFFTRYIVISEKIRLYLGGRSQRE